MRRWRRALRQRAERLRRLAPHAGRGLRLGARLAAAAFGCAIVALIAVQFVRVIQENVALSRSLNEVHNDIVALEAKKERQERDVRRLSDPRGALPEIHDLLRLVGPNQAIIYLKGRTSDGP